MSDFLPQLYLVVPAWQNTDALLGVLEDLCATIDIAALRLCLDGMTADQRLTFCDQLRRISEPRDLPLIATDDLEIINRAALDGIHLTREGSTIAALREKCGAEMIIGAFCGTSQHDGMVAGEQGADYVTFGPVTSADSACVDPDVFSWWSEAIEVPVVAEGGLTETAIRHLSDKVDFFSLGDEIWTHEDPLGIARRLAAARGG